MVELLHDFCHHKMKLVMSDKAALPACMFSGRCYKWKSVAFQLKERKNKWEVFKSFYLLASISASSWKNTTGYLLFSFYITALSTSLWIILFYFTFVLILLSEDLFKKKYSYTESTCLLLFVIPRAQRPKKKKKTFFHSFHLFPFHLQKHLKVHIHLNTPHHPHGRGLSCKHVLALFLLP